MTCLLRKMSHFLNKMALLGTVLGCVATPALPPGPPAEAPVPIPASLQFPDDVSIDVSNLNNAGGGSLLKTQTLPSLSLFPNSDLVALAKAQVLPIGGEFFEAITFGFTIVEGADAALSSLLIELNQLEFPFNPITRTLETMGPPGGLFLGARVKVDFADFEFVGKPQACTGCTCPTGCDAPCPDEALFSQLKPVCFRIWMDPDGTGNFIRLIAGFFEQIFIDDDPTTPENEKNAGTGSFRVSQDSGSPDGGPAHVLFNFGANYNHRIPTRPFDRFTEYLFSSITPVIAPADATNTMVRVEQKALGDPIRDDQLLKTIRESINQEKFEEEEFFSTFQYIAQFRTDKDFWSGTFLDNLLFPFLAPAFPPNIENFTAECAQLSTAIGVDEGTCEDLGIDVTNVPFLDLLTSDDPRVNLPADFPPFPTF